MAIDNSSDMGRGRPREWQTGKADSTITVPREIREEVYRAAKEIDRKRAQEKEEKG